MLKKYNYLLSLGYCHYTSASCHPSSTHFSDSPREHSSGLDTQLILEGTQRGLGVVGPIAPGRPCKAILEKHADDSHHGQPSVRDFGIELLLLHFRVSNGLATQVSWNAQESVLVVGCLLTEQTRAKLSRWVGWHLMHEPQVANSAEDSVLEPTNCGDLGRCGQAVGNVCKLDFTRGRDVAGESEELLDNVSSVPRFNANCSVKVPHTYDQT